jgi:5'-nucleotidase
MANRPLILLTNDDGIDSPGLHAAAQAVADLGDLLIVAPSAQRSGAGRSYPPVHDKTIYPTQIPLNGHSHPAFKADVSPAQSVILAALALAPRPINLCISGINHGENLGSAITTSGTVGAAMEAVNFNIPALAVSFETAKEFHAKISHNLDFSVAGHFTRLFAQQVLDRGLPPGVDLLKIDVPATATRQTPWQVGTVSRQRYYHPMFVTVEGQNDQKVIGYQAMVDHTTLEPYSDVHIFTVQRQVAVVPMTIDLTAPVARPGLVDFFGRN